MYFLGYDIGTSSVKASLVDAKSGECKSRAFYPQTEAPIITLRHGWAEQDPADWWERAKQATAVVLAESRVAAADIKAIGISYQMHGLVCVDRQQRALRPSIIWCDSRAVQCGNQASNALGADWCLQHLLNQPGNFTAAKLAWVKQNEPEIFSKIDKIMLPGDYIAMRMTGEACTTIEGLSEGIFWDFKERSVSRELMDFFGFADSVLPAIVPTFGPQGELTAQAAAELGLKAGTPVTYRAGDQPNNALSLNVFEPGEVASTAGTSGVVYGVLGEENYDKLSRVNTFAHVNYSPTCTRLGELLCINGTGIMNSWVKHNVAPAEASYADINAMAECVTAGSDGLTVLPFGNGAERMLQNCDLGCRLLGLDFNRHTRAHLMRAAQEGVVFAFAYGIEIMQQMGMRLKRIRAGHANMFLNPVFRNTLATVTGVPIELYDTDGALGAAKGAGMGLGYYRDHNEAFASLRKIADIEPHFSEQAAVGEAYALWKQRLGKALADVAE